MRITLIKSSAKLQKIRLRFVNIMVDKDWKALGPGIRCSQDIPLGLQREGAERMRSFYYQSIPIAGARRIGWNVTKQTATLYLLKGAVICVENANKLTPYTVERRKKECRKSCSEGRDEDKKTKLFGLKTFMKLTLKQTQMRSIKGITAMMIRRWEKNNTCELGTAVD